MHSVEHLNECFSEVGLGRGNAQKFAKSTAQVCLFAARQFIA
jgi:hypothetical protein